MQRFRGTAEDRTRLFDNGDSQSETLNGKPQTANRELQTYKPVSFLGVTFAGLDETADLEKLKEIRSLYFTVEWGVRLAVEHQGRETGFPDIDWIRKLAPELNLSAQLRGKSAADFLQGDDAELMTCYGACWAQFRRIQIDSPKHMDAVDLPKLIGLLAKNPEKQIVFRVRDQNLDIADALVAQGIPCATLFDQSEAQDPTQKKWPKGVERFAGCGYAGGLGPDNIYKQLSPILNAAQSAERWWVEIDSSLRTPEEEQHAFSLASCKRTIREFDAFFLDYTI
jgi:hypothetical protein